MAARKPDVPQCNNTPTLILLDIPEELSTQVAETALEQLGRVQFVADTQNDAVIVVWSGAGGAACAHRLATRGAKVIPLEAGSRFTQADYPMLGPKFEVGDPFHPNAPRDHIGAPPPQRREGRLQGCDKTVHTDQNYCPAQEDSQPGPWNFWLLTGNMPCFAGPALREAPAVPGLRPVQPPSNADNEGSAGRTRLLVLVRPNGLHGISTSNGLEGTARRGCETIVIKH